jgi:hypothetical protein
MQSMPCISGFPLMKGECHLKQGGYLVRGQNPDGGRYYGIAQVNVSGQKQEMTWNIGGRKTKCEVETKTLDAELARLAWKIMLRGDFEVTYTGPSWMGTYEGTWGRGGTEELIPVSPLAGRRTS